ncbi:MAG: hypothetical protein KDA75_11425 [Planctomycetaceae bacterium]|nr:hypothetical protein [Planctomycetaceae bacterium]
MRQHGRKIPSGSHRHRAPEITKRQVSPARQALIELGQFLNHGWIEDLPVRGGDPVMDPQPVVFHHFKFKAENGPREELEFHDFVLKEEHLELIAFLDRLKDGVIKRLDFKGGLPFDMSVRGPAV